MTHGNIQLRTGPRAPLFFGQSSPSGHANLSTTRPESLSGPVIHDVL